MKAKKYFLLATIVLLLLICYGVYELYTFSLFDNEAVLIQKAEMKSKGYLIKIYHSPSNATTESSIQVKMVRNGEEKAVKDFERYNYLETCKIVNDTMLMVVMRDTVSILGNKPDTFFVKLQ